MARRKATRNTYTLSKLTWWGQRAWASKLIWNIKEILAYYYIAQNWNQCSENSAESNRPGAAKRCLRDSVLTQKVLQNLLFINKHGDNNTIGLLKGKHNFQHLFWGACPTSVATLERHGTFYHTHNAQAFIWQFVLFYICTNTLAKRVPASLNLSLRSCQPHFHGSCIKINKNKTKQKTSEQTNKQTNTA